MPPIGKKNAPNSGATRNMSIKVMCGVLVVLVATLVVRLWDVPTEVDSLSTESALLGQRMDVVEVWQKEREDVPVQLESIQGRINTLAVTVSEIKSMLQTSLKENRDRILELERGSRIRGYRETPQ